MNLLEKTLLGIKRKTILLATAGLLLTGLGSCHKNSHISNTNLNQKASYHQIQQKQEPLDKILADLNSLPAPKQVKTKTFEQLKDALTDKLISQYTNKITSKPPQGQANKVDDLEIVPDPKGPNYTLTWTYKNVGDYNQDSVVDIKDITPLAFYFQQQANETNEWIDGNEDGIIDIKDITPLASNFGTDCAGYSIQKADTERGSFSEITRVPFSEAKINEVGRKIFIKDSLKLGDFVPEKYIGVAPFDNNGELGEFSDVIILPNLPPIAKLSVSPTEGRAPLEVSFDATGSSDPDGTIEKYEWDFDGDEIYDGNGPCPSYTYETSGTYKATLRVTDNGGLTDTALETIVVEENQKPIARLSANPASGPAPLEVSFDATKSSDPDGNIIKYEWDFDGDEIYDGNGPCPSYTYETFGTYNATLRVTDNNHATATNSLEIKVSGSVAHTFGGEDEDVVKAITVDADGNTWLAGSTRSFSAGGSDVLLLKYNPDGELVLSKTWGGNAADKAESIASDSLGNIYVTGDTSSFSGIVNAFILKYNPDGGLEWQKTLTEKTITRPFALTIDSSGDVYVAGDTYDVKMKKQEVFLTKFNSSGDLLWQTAWGGSSGNYARALTIDSSGDIYVAGFTTSFNDTKETFILKYNPAGKLDWQKTWGITGRRQIFALTSDSNNNIYAAGSITFSGPTNLLLLKYNSNGDLLFSKYYWLGDGVESAEAIKSDSLGDIYIAGYTASLDNVLLLKYNTQGELGWAKTWGTPENDTAYDLFIDNNGILFIAGSAPNAYGNWQDVEGFSGKSYGEERTPTGLTYPLNGQKQNVEGTESSPEGVEDEGGGSLDALFIKYFPE